MNLIIGIFAALLLVYFVHGQDSCIGAPDTDKIDCLPAKETPTENDCQARKCCFKTSKDNVKVPSCYYPNQYPGYKATFTSKHESGVDTMSVITNPSGFAGDAQRVRLTVEYLTENMLRIRLTDPDKKRFEPPIPEIPRFPKVTKSVALNYDVRVTNNPLSVKVTRKATNETIFDTSVGALAFADQFLEISTRLSTNNVYGIGEHTTGAGIMRGGKKQHYPLFNRGELVRAGHPGFNLYGSHAFFVNLEKSGKAHGVYLLNSNAMEMITYETPQLTYRAIGGILDFFVFLGPEPDAVISQYTSIIGRPFLIPYWTLGFHLCRYGYNTTKETRKVWQRNRDAGIYFEAQWNDIDYMDNRRGFTYDKVNYAGLPGLIDEIHEAGMHYMIISEVSLDNKALEGTYLPLDEAKALDILVKDHEGDVLEARVWQDYSSFVDFFHPKAKNYWTKQFKRLYDDLPYDGAWIDMNEPYSFLNGSHKGCPADNTLDNPPYMPGGDIIYNGTICMSAKHYIGEHYNAHNLYGFQEGILTNNAVTQILKKRPFVLSRATFPGYGHFGAHWLGDVISRWEYLEDSVERMIEFNLYGIPMIGSDICGFTDNTTFEMCQRWTEVGAFYPFSRNHNDYNTIEQDPAIMGPEMVELHKKVFHIRYYLLPHFYTIMYHTHVDGIPAIRSLVFEYPNDPKTYDIKNTFLWGKSLLIIPVLEQGKTDVTTYIPAGLWYDYYTQEQINSTGSFMTFDAPVDKINILIKGGNVIPAQSPETTIVASRKNAFHLLVSLDENGEAKGDLYWDDGDDLDPVGEKAYNLITFEASNNSLRIKVLNKGYESPMKLERVTILGVERPVSYANVNTMRAHSSYQTQNKVLKIELTDQTLLEDNELTWFNL